jgi:hypothetical protein
MTSGLIARTENRVLRAMEGTPHSEELRNLHEFSHTVMAIIDDDDDEKGGPSSTRVTDHKCGNAYRILVEQL